MQALSPFDDRSVVLGADASTTRDLTALVGVYVNPETSTRDMVYCRVWKPQPGEYRFGKPTVNLDETIKKEIMRLWHSGNVKAVYYDPYQLHSIALDLEKNGVRMVELSQTSARVEADQALYDAIIGKTIRYYGDPTLNEQIRNAIAVETPRGYRLAKEKTSRKIDAAVALSMAHYGAEKIRRGMKNSTYQHKRDLLDFWAIFRVDEAGRWLDVSCGLKPEGDVIVLDHSLEFFQQKMG